MTEFTWVKARQELKARRERAHQHGGAEAVARQPAGRSGAVG